MSEMEMCYQDLIVPEEMYENWHQDMFEIAQRNPEEKKILIELFENEQNKEVKSWLAGILIDLKEECVFPYLLDVVEMDENLQQRQWAALQLIELESPYIKGVLIGLLKKNKIAKNELGTTLFYKKTSFAQSILNELLKIDKTIAHDVERCKKRIHRQQQFFKSLFHSRAEMLYEGITCGAWNWCLYYELQKAALESEEEREVVFEILAKEPKLHQKYLIAEALLKVDFERALGCLINLVENSSYANIFIAVTLLKLNHPKGIEAFFKKPNYPYDIKDIVPIQTPMARKLIHLLAQKKPGWKDYIKNLNPNLILPD